MNAKEAAAKASLNKKHTEENVKAKQMEQQDKDLALLYKHFHDKIESAVNLGHISTSAANIKIEFAEDRFKNKVITDVVNALRHEGFNVIMERHNAYHTVKFEISWVIPTETTAPTETK